MPVFIRNSGATIFTAARASLPRPRPTNMPSVITKRADYTMPSNVGMSSLLKRLDTFVVPKSILSFIILYGYLLLISGRKSKCLKTKGS